MIELNKSKQGAVEMSLNLIIMLVIGLTVLGLVIAMVTGLIGSATNKFTDKISASDQAIANELKSTPGVLVSRPVQITIPRGGSGLFFSKIQNKGNVEINLPLSETSSSSSTLSSEDSTNNYVYKVEQAKIIGNCDLDLKMPGVGIISQDSQVFPVTVRTEESCKDKDEVLLSIRFYDDSGNNLFDESSSVRIKIKG